MFKTAMASMILFAASISFAEIHIEAILEVSPKQSYEDQANKFPTNPDQNMTPGALCEHGKKRYAEGITYCERDVDTKVKNAVIREYDEKLGFQIRTMNRNDFKIDHFIPLSIGGANSVQNLWPQHKSIYEYSDRLESHLASLMTEGSIKQVEAIRVIKECKLNLGRCAELEDYLKSLYHH